MKNRKLKFINSVAGYNVDGVEEVLLHGRLSKYLWIEFLVNPESVYSTIDYMDNNTIKDNLTKALSWYLAFKWLFKINTPLEEIREKAGLRPFKIRGETYRKDRRTFIKGIVYARLC